MIQYKSYTGHHARVWYPVRMHSGDTITQLTYDLLLLLFLMLFYRNDSFSRWF